MLHHQNKTTIFQSTKMKRNLNICDCTDASGIHTSETKPQQLSEKCYCFVPCWCCLAKYERLHNPPKPLLLSGQPWNEPQWQCCGFKWTCFTQMLWRRQCKEAGKHTLECTGQSGTICWKGGGEGGGGDRGIQALLQSPGPALEAVWTNRGDVKCKHSLL